MDSNQELFNEVAETHKHSVAKSECRYCRAGEIPEWSEYSHCFIHRNPTLDRKCENPGMILNNVLVGCAQLLDTIKSEWSESWSEWDQSIRNGITAILESRMQP